MPRASQALDGRGQIVIAKYDNRRLYDRGTSEYVTYEDLTDMIRAGHKIRVVQAGTEEDITAMVLLRVLFNIYEDKEHYTPERLHQLIRSANRTGKTVED